MLDSSGLNSSDLNSSDLVAIGLLKTLSHPDSNVTARVAQLHHTVAGSKSSEQITRQAAESLES
jgi:hypothetical protein